MNYDNWKSNEPDPNAFEDKPLDVADVPQDGEPYPDPRDPPVLSRSGDERPDPAALAELAILSACKALEIEIAKVSSAGQAQNTLQTMRRIWRRVEDVYQLAAVKETDFYPAAWPKSTKEPQ